MSRTGVRFEDFFKWKVTLKPEHHISEKSDLLHWSGFRIPWAVKAAESVVTVEMP